MQNTRDEIERRLNAFFGDPENLDHLPLDDTDHLFGIRREADTDGMAVYGFSVREKKGEGSAVRFKCNPAELALLQTIDWMGASTFVNNAGVRPYLKVCGQMKSKAGFTAGRLFAGHEEGEDTRHLNNDSCDLTHQNLGERRNPRTKSGRMEICGELLLIGLRTDEKTLERIKTLLHRALECNDAEREAALRKIAA